METILSNSKINFFILVPPTTIKQCKLGDQTNSYSDNMISTGNRKVDHPLNNQLITDAAGLKAIDDNFRMRSNPELHKIFRKLVSVGYIGSKIMFG